MKNWWPSILIFICFSLAAFKIRQANALNDQIIKHYLSGNASQNLSSKIPEIDYLESLQLITQSVDLNAKLQLNKKNNFYDFQFTSIYNSEQQWVFRFEKSEDMLILTEITGLESYKEIIYCQ